ncbi:group I truncated hemoglobin [Rhodopirellula europaea]|nr:group 1 truncated hemoglobin [Rhodopirellula europaea]|tara:strand:+ start:3283 stop:3666 length:384 start_codon:yes stop_codon:yes gene_type:complete
MSQSEPDLLGQLGGMDGVRRVVDEMYVRVLADPELTHFFDGVPMEKLARMQTEFIASITSGDIQYTGADLTKVHAGRGITGVHFSKFCGHLTDALEANNVSSHAIDQVLGKLAMYSDKITGSSNVDG